MIVLLESWTTSLELYDHIRTWKWRSTSLTLSWLRFFLDLSHSNNELGFCVGRGVGESVSPVAAKAPGHRTSSSSQQLLMHARAKRLQMQWQYVYKRSTRTVIIYLIVLINSGDWWPQLDLHKENIAVQLSRAEHRCKDISITCSCPGLTMLNTDYKIFTRVLATRMRKVVHEFVKEYQKGFMPRTVIS